MADTTQNILINIDLETGKVESELEKIDSKINDLGKDAKIETFKSVRTQIREAREEAVRLAIAIEDADGANVDELNKKYAEATKRAAQLNDAVSKANDTIANQNPDNRLQGLIQIAQGAAVAVQGLAGAFTILGVDSETANVALAKLQGLIALTDAIGSVDTIIDGYKDLRRVIGEASVATRANNLVTSLAAGIQQRFTGSVNATGFAFKALKTAIAATGIGLLVTLLAPLISRLFDYSDAANDAADAQERLNEKIAEADANKFKGLDNALKLRLAKLRAAGASELELEEAKLDGLIKLQGEYNSQLLPLELEARGAIDAARKAALDKQIKDLKAGLDEAKFQQELAEEEIRRIKREGTEKTDKEQKELRAKNNEEIKAERENNLKELNDLQQNLRDEEKRRRQTDFEKEVDDIKKKYQRAIELTRAYGRSTVELEVMLSSELIAARLKSDETGRRFFLEESFKIVENQAKEIATRVEKLAEGGTIVPEEVKKQFSDEIKAVFADGAKLRLELADQIRKERIKQAEALLKDTPELRDRLIKGFNDDFKIATQQIKDEINNSEQSLNKGIQLIIDKATQLQVENRIKNLENLLEETTKPLRKDIVGESGLERFFRKTFTTITLVGEDFLSKQDKLSVEILDSENKKIIERFNTQESYAKDELELKKITASESNKIALGQAEIERNNAILSGKNKLEADIEFINKSTKIQEDYQNEILKLDEDFETESKNRLNRANQERLDNEQKRNEIISKARREAERGLFSTEAAQPSFTRNFLSGDISKEAFDKALSATQNYYDALKEQENSRYLQELSNARFQGAELEKVELQHKENLKRINQNYVTDIDILNQAQLAGKLELYDSISNALANLGSLFDSSTTVSKVAALSSIAIDTAAGFTRGLAIAQQTSQAAGPGAAYAFPIFYAQQIAAVLAAANRAKQILTKVKGGNGTEFTSNSAPTTITPINASVFNLPPQAQDVRVTNQANQVIRAYITNEDLRTAQERQQFLNKLSSF